MTISDRDRKILWGRSGERCAICRRKLVADRRGRDSESAVGDEAHIVARSPGGPRFREMEEGVVDSYENRILLCKVDHKVVDDQLEESGRVWRRTAAQDQERPRALGIQSARGNRRGPSDPNQI